METGASSSGQEVLQLRGISPLIWRRLLVRSDTSIAELHQVLQIVFDWQDMHLHRFEIRGREYGVHRDGGNFFDTNAHAALIGQLKLRRLERFTYEYDFGDGWMHDLRIEASFPIDPKRMYPVCIAGRRAAPPEDCGGPVVFMANRSAYLVIGESESWHEIDDLIDEVDGEDWDILRHYHPERFDRCQRMLRGHRRKEHSGRGCGQSLRIRSSSRPKTQAAAACHTRVAGHPSFVTAAIQCELGAFIHPRSEHILDWFHVAMRVEQLLQTTRGLHRSEGGEVPLRN